MSDSCDTERSPSTDPIQRAVEVEYWVVDERGNLTGAYDLVDGIDGVEREFVEPLVEIKTSPCATTATLRAELFERIDRVLSRARTVGKRLVPLATPLHDGHIADIESERTRIQDRVVGRDFEYVRHCAGTHIHVEQQPGQEGDQLNALTALDPALALVNSAPYYGHERLAAGARSKLYRWLAYQRLAHQGELWRYVDDREAWGRRLESRYKEFVTEAVIAGCDRDTVESHFDPDSAAWTPVKFREMFSTVEWRSPDTALPSQVLQLADDVTGVVERAVAAPVRVEGRRGEVTQESVVLPEFDAVQDYVEAAIRDGLSAEPVRRYLSRMGFDVSAYNPLTAEVDRGPQLEPADARQIRLAYADRLETDVRQRRSVVAD